MRAYLQKPEEYSVDYDTVVDSPDRMVVLKNLKPKAHLEDCDITINSRTVWEYFIAQQALARIRNRRAGTFNA